MVLLHGLLGNKKNLKTYARRVVERFPNWKILLMDLPGHGETGGNFNDGPGITLRGAADECAATCEGLGVKPELVCGHSMGGKVALSFLESALDGRFVSYFGQSYAPRSTWALDSQVGLVDRARIGGSTRRHFDSVEGVLETVARVKTPVSSRSSLVEELKAYGASEATALWMTTNTRPAPAGGIEFVFDLPTVRSLFASYGTTDLTPLVARVAAGAIRGRNPTVDIVIAGRNTSAWPPAILDALRSSCGAGNLARVHLLQGAGHNVHIDNPAGLLDIMAKDFAADAYAVK